MECGLYAIVCVGETSAPRTDDVPTIQRSRSRSSYVIRLLENNTGALLSANQSIFNKCVYLSYLRLHSKHGWSIGSFEFSRHYTGTTFYFALERGANIVMSLSVCSHGLTTTRPNFTKFLCTLPVATARFLPCSVCIC